MKKLCLVFILPVLLFLLTLAGTHLVVTEMPDEKADVIVVLSGNDDTRLETAAALYHEGYADSIMLTNTGERFGEFDHPYTMLQKERLKELDVPEGGIYLADFQAKNTGQEATGIIKMMAEMSARRAIIVTDPWHTRRVKTIFSDSFGNTGDTLYYCPVRGTGFNKYFWYLTPSNWRPVVGEYVRILGYYIKRDTNIPDYPSF